LSDSAYTISATLSQDAMDTLRQGVVKDDSSSFAGWTIHLKDYHFEVAGEPSSIRMFVNALDVRSRLALVSPRVPELVDDSMVDRVLKSLKYDQVSEKWIPKYIFPKLTKGILEIPAEQEKVIRDTFSSQSLLSQPLDDSDDESVVRFLEQNQQHEHEQEQEQVLGTGMGEDPGGEDRLSRENIGVEELSSSSVVLSQYDPSEWDRLVDSHLRSDGDEGGENLHDDDGDDDDGDDQDGDDQDQRRSVKLLHPKSGGGREGEKESRHDIEDHKRHHTMDDVEEIESPSEGKRACANENPSEMVVEGNRTVDDGRQDDMESDVEIIEDGSIEVEDSQKEEEKKGKDNGSISSTTAFFKSHGTEKRTESGAQGWMDKQKRRRNTRQKRRRASATHGPCDWDAFCGSMGYAPMADAQVSTKKRKK
jgi:hypothetical protein